MDYDKAQQILQRHITVIEGAAPTPSREDHDYTVGLALQWALDNVKPPRKRAAKVEAEGEEVTD